MPKAPVNYILGSRELEERNAEIAELQPAEYAEKRRALRVVRVAGSSVASAQRTSENLAMLECS